jgi:hypothetical protein
MKDANSDGKDTEKIRKQMRTLRPTPQRTNTNQSNEKGYKTINTKQRQPNHDVTEAWAGARSPCSRDGRLRAASKAVIPSSCPNCKSFDILTIVC